MSRRRAARVSTAHVTRAVRRGLKDQARDAAGVLIHHDGEVEPPAIDAKVGEIADPDLVGSRHARRPEAVWVLRVMPVQAGLGAIAAHGFGAQPVGPHEPRDASAADAPPGRSQEPVEPRTAVALRGR